MRHIRIAVTALGIAFALSGAAPLWAQDGAVPAMPGPAAPGAAPHVTASIAEKLFQRGLGESRAAVILMWQSFWPMTVPAPRIKP